MKYYKNMNTHTVDTAAGWELEDIPLHRLVEVELDPSPHAGSGGKLPIYRPVDKALQAAAERLAKKKYKIQYLQRQIRDLKKLVGSSRARSAR